MIEKVSIVLGLGYGDEGKGVVTSTLATPRSLVVRFNGGHQAGHTVVKNGVRHVFSTYGSGSLNTAATFITQHCTFYPIAAVNEHVILKEKIDFLYQKAERVPSLYVHPLCPVTTPFDVEANHGSEYKNQHGSVGVGFGQTLQRHELIKLYVNDLRYPTVANEKLRLIHKYYRERELNNFQSETELTARISLFMMSVLHCMDFIVIEDRPQSNGYYNHAVFEGAQGILLDQDHGFFPHVTRSHTTCRNAQKLLTEEWQQISRRPPDIYYVTRCYQTRHGNGPFPLEQEIKLINNENENNKEGTFQGKFRVGEFSPEMIKYALDCDALYSTKNGITDKKMVITCVDQRPDFDFRISKNVFGMRVYNNSSPEGNYETVQAHPA